MHAIWIYIKPLLRLFFGSEDNLSFAKENILLISGFFLNMPIMYRRQIPTFLNFLHLTGKGVEIGVQDGMYSEILMHYSSLSKLYSVDPWLEYDNGIYNDIANVSQHNQDELYISTQKRLQKFSARSEILRMTSEEAASLFNDESLDFVYIDANHSYEAVTEDLKLWWPKVKSGGVFAGHDFLDGYIEPQGLFGVKRAVKEFAKKYKQKIYRTPERFPTWYMIKNEKVKKNFSLYNYMRKELKEQYKNLPEWRRIRGIPQV